MDPIPSLYKLGLTPEVLQRLLQISSPVGRIVVLKWACQQIWINLENLEFYVDLVVLSIHDFDVNIGVYWLSSFRFQILVT